MATHVTNVTLTLERDGQGHTLWRLRWTVRGGRHPDTLTMTHYTEQAARRHATSLVAQRPPGTAVADIFTDAR